MHPFTLALLILGFMIGFAGGARPERWRRTLAVIVAASLPLLAWLVLCASGIFVDGYRLDEPRFRGGLGMGLALAISVIPIWILVGFLGNWLRGRISRRR